MPMLKLGKKHSERADDTIQKKNRRSQIVKEKGICFLKRSKIETRKIIMFSATIFGSK
jgi:hypothetical protein